MQHEDIVFKNIMELFKGDAVKFFGVDKKIVSAARTELLQIDLQKNIDDWVLVADDDSFVHFEFQSTDKPDDVPRFMVSDAILYYKERKPIQTVVVYSADIPEAKTEIHAGSIDYHVKAFYMVKLDGDKTYADLCEKIKSGEPLTKQDLMNIVFMPLMKNSVDKATRIEQTAALSREIKGADEQTQVQAMIGLLADKFIGDEEVLKRIKELIGMGKIFEMMKEDIARNALKKGATIAFTQEITGLDEATVRRLQAELEKQSA